MTRRCCQSGGVEGRGFADGAVDPVGEEIVGVVEEAQVGFDRTDGFGRKQRIIERSEDRLAADHDDLSAAGDARGGPERVGELLPGHWWFGLRVAHRKAARTA